METKLRETKALLDKGWIKGSYYQAGQGFCLVGALVETTGEGYWAIEDHATVESELLHDVMVEQFPDRESRHIVDFNDDDDTTWDDIDLIFEKAIARSEEM